MKPNIGIVLLVLLTNFDNCLGKQSNSVIFSERFETSGILSAWRDTNFPTFYGVGPINPPASEKKAEQLSIEAAKKKNLIPLDWNRFEGKHLFNNGKAKDKNGNVLDSFEELSKNEGEVLRKYLLNANMKLVNGRVLPKGPVQVERWVTDDDFLGKRFLTIIDSDIESLQKDVDKQFQEWISKQKPKADGKLSKDSLAEIKKENLPQRNRIP